jgi:hypothetical protein
MHIHQKNLAMNLFRWVFSIQGIIFSLFLQIAGFALLKIGRGLL